jgi:riboflavin kinase/FMN adenylyltransferase
VIVLEGDVRDWTAVPHPHAVTIGMYDGVHRGHQKVLAELRAVDPDLPLAVVTFRDHPAVTLRPEDAPLLLTSIDQRLELLEALGADVVAVVEFDDRFRRLQADRFVEQILVRVLRARLVAVGDDFRFGYRLGGDVALLETLGQEHGFAVRRVGIFEDGEPVRSTAIRRVLAEGDVATAWRLLGRPYQLRGRVVAGDGRGKTIGFPTANLDIDPRVFVPASGVYAVRCGTGSARWPGVINIGVRPTFGGTESVVEAHILDFDGDLYGHELRVDFRAWIRAEQKFPGVDALVSQITADVATARVLLGED